MLLWIGLLNLLVFAVVPLAFGIALLGELSSGHATLTDYLVLGPLSLIATLTGTIFLLLLGWGTPVHIRIQACPARIIIACRNILGFEVQGETFERPHAVSAYYDGSDDTESPRLPTALFIAQQGVRHTGVVLPESGSSMIRVDRKKAYVSLPALSRAEIESVESLINTWLTSGEAGVRTLLEQQRSRFFRLYGSLRPR
jgi:hypothetical protein